MPQLTMYSAVPAFHDKAIPINATASSPVLCTTVALQHGLHTTILLLNRLHQDLGHSCTGAVRVAETNSQVASLRFDVAKGAAAFADPTLRQLGALADDLADWCRAPEAYWRSCLARLKVLQQQQPHIVKSLHTLRNTAAELCSAAESR